MSTPRTASFGARVRQALRVLAGAPARTAQRLYGGARHTRTTGSFGAGAGSADAELHTSLTVLRARSRQVVRDNAYAKRAKTLMVNNVIGPGVGMQAQVRTVKGAMAVTVNDAIEAAWSEWSEADSCHTGGALHFSDLERALMGEVFEAGEVLVRMHKQPFGRSRVPFALELIEAERLAHDHVELQGVAAGNEVRMGVEVDAYQRPVAYWIRQRHGGDIRVRMDTATDRVERVPAAEILHLRVVNRWPQTRGEPWMHAILRKLDDLNEYTQHEVTAARASAAMFATIETPDDNPSVKTDEEDSGAGVMDMEPLTIQALAPGEQLKLHAPTRPNVALEGFMRALLREMAVGVSASYASLSGDYSQTNYSSSRLALLDDRDIYRALQQWWVRAFRRPVHREWLRWAVMARAVPGVSVEAYGVDSARYEAALFKPRGWSWVDPTKEVQAYKDAVRCGFSTVSDVIAATGNGADLEDVLQTRKRELEAMQEAGIQTDTHVQEPVVAAPAAAPAAAAPPQSADDEDKAAEDDAARAAPRVVALPARTA